MVFRFVVPIVKTCSLGGTTDCKTDALIVRVLRIKVRMIKVLIAGGCSQMCSRRPIITLRVFTVKTSRAPVVETSVYKRKRFGENTGISSGKANVGETLFF